MVQETVKLEGHLIDSDILRRVFDRIVEEGGEFEVLDFHVGKTNDDASSTEIAVKAKDPQTLDTILEGLGYLGAVASLANAQFGAAEADGILPDEFYSTTNFDTFLRIDGKWTQVLDQRMDCALVVRDGAPRCVKQRLVRKGEPVALRGGGIRVRPPERSREASVFGFMSNDISAEINKGIAIRGTAREMRRAKEAKEKIVLVAGPAIVHSGGDGALARLVRDGWVDVILTGNAFAVHDLEKSILKTSLGVCQFSGRALEGGSRNHLFAINAVNRVGGIRAAVESGLVRSGVMFEAIQRGTTLVLAGSIRDDGPAARHHHGHDRGPEGLRGGPRRRRGVPHARLGLAFDRGREPAARARAHGVRGHDGIGAGEALEPRDHAGDRPRHRRRLLPGTAGNRASSHLVIAVQWLQGTGAARRKP